MSHFEISADAGVAGGLVSRYVLRMAEVVTLKRGQSPPEAEDWIIVQELPSGRHTVAAVEAHSKGMTYSYEPVVLGQRESVIAQACAAADRRGIARVYVFEPAEASDA